MQMKTAESKAEIEYPQAGYTGICGIRLRECMTGPALRCCAKPGFILSGFIGMYGIWGRSTTDCFRRIL